MYNSRKTVWCVNNIQVKKNWTFLVYLNNMIKAQQRAKIYTILCTMSYENKHGADEKLIGNYYFENMLLYKLL